MQLEDALITDGLDNVGGLSEFIFLAGRNDIKTWPTLAKNNDFSQPGNDAAACTATGNFVMNRSKTAGQLSVAKAGGFSVGETVTGAESAATGVVASISGNILNLTGITGSFFPGEAISGGTSAFVTEIGGNMVINTLSGALTVGETLTGGTSAATAIYRGISAVGGNTIIVDTIDGGPFDVGETITGGTSHHTAVVESIVVGHLSVGSVNSNFSTSDVITGGISGATATVAFYDTTYKELTITNISGKFVPNEIVTGSVSGATAQILGALNFAGLKFATIQLTNETGGVTLKKQGNPDGQSYMSTLVLEVPRNSVVATALRRKLANWAGAVVFKDLNDNYFLLGTRDLPARATGLDNANGPKSSAGAMNKFTFEAASPVGPVFITQPQVPGIPA